VHVNLFCERTYNNLQRGAAEIYIYCIYFNKICAPLENYNSKTIYTFEYDHIFISNINNNKVEYFIYYYYKINTRYIYIQIYNILNYIEK